MRTIRYGVFETNSSSVHTITFSRRNIKPSEFRLDKDGKILMSYGSFGKEEAVYDDQYTKLQYLVTLIGYLCPYPYGDEEWHEHYDARELEEALIEYMPACTGIKIVDDGSEPDIDHQSIPYGYVDFINLWNHEAVQNFIFNNDILLETGCD